jgi:hypothetical protein
MKYRQQNTNKKMKFRTMQHSTYTIISLHNERYILSAINEQDQ